MQIWLIKNVSWGPGIPSTLYFPQHIPDTPGNSGVILDESINHIPPLSLISKGFQTFGTDKIPTFMDSGASDTMFVSRDTFIDYKAITPHRRFCQSSRLWLWNNWRRKGYSTISCGEQRERNYLYSCSPHPKCLVPTSSRLAPSTKWV